mgnify:CR=1 FL=1
MVLIRCLICEWESENHHEAFPGMLNGGIIGSLLDCHSNWAAAHFLMKENGKNEPDSGNSQRRKRQQSRKQPERNADEDGFVIHYPAVLTEVSDQLGTRRDPAHPSIV